MNDDRPLVTAILISYNHAAFVEEAIRSVLRQTYDNVEFIVIDDASTDGSRELIERLRQQEGFEVIYNERNLGIQETLTRVVAAAHGEWLTTVTSDDMMMERKVEKLLEHALTNDYEVVYAGGYRLDAGGRSKMMKMDRVARMFENGTMLEHMYTCDTYGPMIQSGLFRTEVFREASKVRSDFQSDDWALSIKLLEKYRVGFLNEPLFIYRVHGSNLHQNYWRTFPMRVEVVARLTPAHLRHIALAQLLISQAGYLVADGKYAMGIRHFLSALPLHVPLRQVYTFGKTLALALATRIFGFRRENRPAVGTED